MSVPERLPDEAAKLYKHGYSQGAVRSLRAVVDEQPKNETAWFLLVRTLKTRAERIAAARAWLEHNPESEKARQVLQYLLSMSPAEPAPKQPPQRRSSMRKAVSWSLLVLALAMTFVILVPLYNSMSARAEALEDQVILLGNQNYENESEYIGLLNEYNNLQQEFHVLTGDFSSQDANLVELRASYDRLKADHNQLAREYAQLQARYALLNEQFRSYQGNTVAPPFIAIQGRNINLAFRKLDGTQINWSIPVDRYERDVERGIKARSGLFGMGMPVLRLTHGPNQEVWVTDFRDFMDPSPFVNVMTDIYEQSTDDRAFITETWYIVGQMIGYVFEEDEIPRYPLETLVGGGGDCEDTAVLFASMIKAAPVDWKLELVYMNSKSPTDPMGFSDHVIVFIDTGKEHFYIETTRTDAMEPYTDGVVGWFVPLN